MAVGYLQQQAIMGGPPASAMGGRKEPAFGSINLGMPIAVQPSAPAEFPWDKFTAAFKQSAERNTIVGDEWQTSFNPAGKIPSWYDFLPK